MKKLLIAASLFLSACTHQTAGHALLGANTLYIAASNAGEAAVRAGTLDKARYKDLDRQAYAALIAFREGRGTIEQLRAALKPLEEAK